VPAGFVADAVGAVEDGAVDEGAVSLADADADGDGVAWRCLVRAADGLGDSEAGTLATAAWKGCPAQDPDPAAAESQSRDARGVAISTPVADAGAGTAPRVR
jgi:hypothetical protein